MLCLTCLASFCVRLCKQTDFSGNVILNIASALITGVFVVLGYYERTFFKYTFTMKKFYNLEKALSTSGPHRELFCIESLLPKICLLHLTVNGKY